MTDPKKLKAAAEMVKANDAHDLNESREYRLARDALLAEEIELRRHIERVAEQRRALPPGGKVAKKYHFDGKEGLVDFADLFGGKQTLVIYSFMYGPQRKEGCPMCSSQMSAWDGIAPHVEQRVAFAMVARSPIRRIAAFAEERGWKNLALYSDTSGDYTRDYVSAEDADMPAYNVFTRKDGSIRHFWRMEGARRLPTPGRTRTMPRTCQHCGPSLTQRPKGAVRSGMRSWTTHDSRAPPGTEKYCLVSLLGRHRQV